MTAGPEAAHQKATGQPEDSRGHFVSTLGFEIEPEPDDWHANGSITIDAYLQADRAEWPNLSALLTLADVLIGRLASRHTSPRISLTGNLGVRLFAPPGAERVRCHSELRKVGRTMSVGDALFYAEGSDEPFGSALGTFLASPRPVDEAPQGFPPEGSTPSARARRLAEQLGIRNPEPGVAQVSALRADLGNPAGSLQGGVVAMLGESATYSAVRSAGLSDHVVDGLSVHYLAANRLGPFRATAQLMTHDPAMSSTRVELRDLGADRLTALIEATTRPFAG